jgi:hypothetical protein
MPNARFFLISPEDEDWREVDVHEYIAAAKQVGAMPLTNFVTPTLRGIVTTDGSRPRVDARLFPVS